MSEKQTSARDMMIPDGWAVDTRSHFMALLGPILRRGTEDVYGFIAQEKHDNVGGVTHGGMLMSILDSAMGRTAGAASGGKLVVTIQLNTHFVSSLKKGELAVCESSVVKAGGSMIFMQGTMLVGERVIAVADGVWKILDKKPLPTSIDG